MKEWKLSPRFRSMTTPVLVSGNNHYTFLDTSTRSERIKRRLNPDFREPATSAPGSGSSTPDSELTTPTPQSQSAWSAMLIADMTIRWSIIDDGSHCNTVMVQVGVSGQILAARVNKYGSIPAKTKQKGWRIMEDRFSKKKRLLLVLTLTLNPNSNTHTNKHTLVSRYQLRQHVPGSIGFWMRRVQSPASL